MRNMLRKISDVDLGIFDKMNIAYNWNKIVGKEIAKRSSPRKIKNDVLTILVLSPTWSHHINCLRHDIMRSIREKLGLKIKKIVLINSTLSKKNNTGIKFYNENLNFVMKRDESNIDFSSIFSKISNVEIKDRLSSLARASHLRKESLKSIWRNFE